MTAITTQLVQCKDCHRCVRACPVKAIAIEEGQAKIVDSYCVLCGQCVIECPQEAKKVENHSGRILTALAQKKQVIFSLAPSFAANFSDIKSLLAKLHHKGVSFAEETSVAVRKVAEAYTTTLATQNGPVISSCCPVTVSLIKKYYPELTAYLAPVQSPMLVHGKLLKEAYPNSFVVFVGPCIAKIDEASPYQFVDAVLTFSQLKDWLNSDGIKDLPQAGELTGELPYYRDRTYGAVGGIIQAITGDAPKPDNYVMVDGLKDCMTLFDYLRKEEWKPAFVEAFACHGGCINGPATACDDPLAVKRQRVLLFAEQGQKATPAYTFQTDVSCSYEPEPVLLPRPTEQQIREILKLTGKETRRDEQNCGACGYDTCRDKARAVYQGFAELEMCVPYMRQKAESLANLVVEHSLNAIIVVDQHLVVQQCNRTAQDMFGTHRRLEKGVVLSEFMDCSDFLSVIETGKKILRKRVEYGIMKIITEQQIVPIPEENLFIGIITDVTEHERKVKAFEGVKIETVQKATEIINKQMQVAQEIAGLLGETTAETKSALLELIWLLKDKEDK